MKCGFYEKEITPPLGADMPGYYANRLSEGVEDKLYAKAAVFSDGERELAFVVIDAVDLYYDFCEAVKERASEFTGIPKEQIAVTANHSHYGIPNGDVCSKADEGYMQVAIRLIADCITLAWQRMQPCSLAYGIGAAKNVAYNRDFIMKDGSISSIVPTKKTLEVDRPYGGVDEDLPVLTVYNEEKRPIAAIFTLALHQDTTAKLRYSGDYSSEASKRLKAVYGQDFISVYLPGFSGDVNHIDTMGKKAMLEAIAAGEAEETAALKYNKLDHRKIGKVVAEAVQQVMEEKSAPICGDKIGAKRRDLTVLRRHATPEQLKAAQKEKEETGKASLLLLYEEECGGEETVLFPVQTFRIGDCSLFFTPGEIYHDYAKLLKEGAPGGKWLMAELSNTLGGYMPIPALYGTGAYPAQLCFGSFVTAEAPDQIIAALLEMAEELKD